MLSYVLNSRNNLIFVCSIITLLSVSSCEVLRTKSNASVSPRASAPSPRTKAKPEAVASTHVKNLLKIARSYTGVPYLSGGNDENGIDCSGLLCNSFKELGILLPRVSWQQSEFFPAIDMPNIQKGDLVFFVTTGKNINHAGIVTEVKGEDEVLFIHASSSKGVREDNMMNAYWKARFARVCRPDFVK
ncbi:C40 family peptidase [Emticicia sp. 17c]|uniref:C40 family peptidase n=1 Tax=Emticicia sp. 17c TaxID=3127704 RepID=UPI00301D1511